MATDLRVSLTDRCNLRCTYCMPAEGLPWLPSDELLSDDELVRLVSVAASLGVRTVRLTGGEPLIRPGLPGLPAARPVPALRGVRGHPALADAFSMSPCTAFSFSTFGVETARI